MNYNDCDELYCEMMSLRWLDNNWAMCDGYIEVLQVFIDNLGFLGIKEILPKFQ
jgi:hypothetical protein